jgi:hypothetical protein
VKGTSNSLTKRNAADKPDNPNLDLVGARSASLELAILALENVPVRPRVTHGADPLN